MSALLPCPCCDFATIESYGDFDICPVCGWEDDGANPEIASHLDGGEGGPNGKTLREGRREFAAMVSSNKIPALPRILSGYCEICPMLSFSYLCYPGPDSPWLCQAKQRKRRDSGTRGNMQLRSCARSRGILKPILNGGLIASTGRRALKLMVCTGCCWQQRRAMSRRRRKWEIAMRQESAQKSTQKNRSGCCEMPHQREMRAHSSNWAYCPLRDLGHCLKIIIKPRSTSLKLKRRGLLEMLFRD